MDDYNNNSRLYEKRALAIVLAICAVIILVMYNHFVDVRNDVELAESNVETMMQRRLELIPDLVSTVKAYTKHEEQVYADIAKAEQVYADIAKARETLGNSFSTGDPDTISEANENLSIAVNSLIFIAEKYPDLTSGEQYTSLMDQLEGSVNRITIAREEYNEKVAIYNKTIQHYPEKIWATVFGFKEIKPFKADKAANNPYMVKFED